MSEAHTPIPMTKGKPIVLGVLTIIAFGCAMAFVVAWRIKATIRQLPPPIPSPDGKLMASLAVDEEQTHTKSYMRLAVEIRDAKTNEVLFKRQTTASAMRQYELAWEGDDRLTLDSAEIGRKLGWARGSGGWSDDAENGENVVPAVPTTGPATKAAPGN